jgi:hypothetical protein
MKEGRIETRRLTEKSRVEQLKQDYLSSYRQSLVEHPVVTLSQEVIEREATCEKCGRVYYDHEHKY